MLRFIVRRVLVAIPVLFGLSVALFLFLRLLPGGGPAEAILGQHATPELVAQISATEGFDKPLYVQYLNYLGRLFQGDFGTSFIDGRQVADTFLIRFPGTVELTMGAMIFAVGVGVTILQAAGNPLIKYLDREVNYHRNLTLTIGFCGIGAVSGFTFCPACGGYGGIFKSRLILCRP